MSKTKDEMQSDITKLTTEILINDKISKDNKKKIIAYINIMCDLDYYIIDVDKLIDKQKNETENEIVTYWDDKFKAIMESVQKRRKTAFKNILNNLIKKEINKDDIINLIGPIYNSNEINRIIKLDKGCEQFDKEILKSIARDNYQRNEKGLLDGNNTHPRYSETYKKMKEKNFSSNTICQIHLILEGIFFYYKLFDEIDRMLDENIDEIKIKEYAQNYLFNEIIN